MQTVVQAVFRLVSSKEFADKFVICAGGFDLGQINGFEMDLNSWRITHLHVKLSKNASEDLGFKKRIGSSTVCVPVALVTSVGDNVLLNKTLDELSKTPEITECK